MEDKIRRLKKKLARINTVDLLSFVADQLIPTGQNGKELADSVDIGQKTNLRSPLRQYCYLCALLLTTDFDPKNPIRLDAPTIEHLEDAVNDITDEYVKNSFCAMVEGGQKPEDARKLSAWFDEFTSYYGTGKLNYAEQTENKIERLFEPFDSFFRDSISLTAKDAIDIYRSICDLYQETENNFMEGIEEAESRRIKEGRRVAGGVDSALKALDEELSTNEVLMSKLNNLHIVTRKSLEERFGKEKTRAFLLLFACRREKKDYYYYADVNPFLQKPLVEISDGEYFITFLPFIIEAIYDRLNQTISAESSLAKKKADAVEKLVLDCFKSIFGSRAIFYEKVCEHPKTNEHDLLILYKENILLVEIKGSKLRQVMFDPEKDFIRLKRHFFSPAGMGYGYKQAIALKKRIESAKNVTLYAHEKEAFSVCSLGKKILPIVITLESFGGLEINASCLLTPEAGQPYPWMCWLDDLENIQRILQYQGESPDSLIRYIKFRMKHYKNLYATDELEILECFQHNLFSAVKDTAYYVQPMGKSLIDKIHFESLGIPYEYEFSLKVQMIKKNENELG